MKDSKRNFLYGRQHSVTKHEEIGSRTLAMRLELLYLKEDFLRGN